MVFFKTITINFYPRLKLIHYASDDMKSGCQSRRFVTLRSNACLSLVNYSAKVPQLSIKTERDEATDKLLISVCLFCATWIISLKRVLYTRGIMYRLYWAIFTGGLYDRQRLCLKPLHQMSVVGAAVPPGYPGIGGVASFPISPRLARIMVVLSFLPVSGATLRSIYRNLLQSWLEDFPAYSLTHHRQLAKVRFCDEW